MTRRASSSFSGGGSSGSLGGNTNGNQSSFGGGGGGGGAKRARLEGALIGLIAMVGIVTFTSMQVFLLVDTSAKFHFRAGDIEHQNSKGVALLVSPTLACTNLTAGHWQHTPKINSNVNSNHNGDLKGKPDKSNKQVLTSDVFGVCEAVNVSEHMKCVHGSNELEWSWASEGSCGRVARVDTNELASWMAGRVFTIVGGLASCRMFQSLLCIIGGAIDIEGTRVARKFLEDSLKEGSGGFQTNLESSRLAIGCGTGLVVLQGGGIVSYFPTPPLPSRLSSLRTFISEQLHQQEQQQQQAVEPQTKAAWADALSCMQEPASPSAATPSSSAAPITSLPQSVVEIREGRRSERDVLLVEDSLGLEWHRVMKCCGDSGSSDSGWSVQCEAMAHHVHPASDPRGMSDHGLPTPHSLQAATARAFENLVRAFEGSIVVIVPPSNQQKQHQQPGTEGSFSKLLESLFSRASQNDQFSFLSAHFRGDFSVVDFRPMYTPALEASPSLATPGGGVIACMQHQPHMWISAVLLAHLCHSNCVVFDPLT